jgi:hypothetical protein
MYLVLIKIVLFQRTRVVMETPIVCYNLTILLVNQASAKRDLGKPQSLNKIQWLLSFWAYPLIRNHTKTQWTKKESVKYILSKL